MRIDLHLHTVYGSACSNGEPDGIIKRAMENGLDGICITEHDHVWGRDAIDRLRQKHGFLVIGGVEVDTDYGEILTFGLHRPVLNINTALELQEAVDEVGGAMVLAHPFRAEPQLTASYSASRNGDGEMLSPEIMQVFERPVFDLVDAMEVYNGRSVFKERDFTLMAAKRMNIKGTGGSDAHSVVGVGACHTLFENDITDERGLIDQIKAGTFTAIDQRWKN
jgi:predicted metal-dependent phosphoesterase TrpH